MSTRDLIRKGRGTVQMSEGNTVSLFEGADSTEDCIVVDSLCDEMTTEFCSFHSWALSV